MLRVRKGVFKSSLIKIVNFLGAILLANRFPWKRSSFITGDIFEAVLTCYYMLKFHTNNLRGCWFVKARKAFFMGLLRVIVLRKNFFLIFL